MNTLALRYGFSAARVLLLLWTAVGVFPTLANAATPADNERLRDEISFWIGALDASVVLGLVPFDPISRPAELQEYAINIGLKYTAPVFNPPADVALDPNTADGCKLSTRVPQLEDKYEDWFGFWNISPLAVDWGDFGSPSVLHANSSVLVRARPSVAATASDPNVYEFPEGRHSISWEASTQLSPSWDIAIPLAMMALNGSIESRYGSAIAKKIAGASTGAARKAKIALAEAMYGIAQAATDRAVSYSLDDSWDDEIDTASNRARQSFIVWDTHTPRLSTASPVITLEARNFGGTFFSKAYEELEESLNYSDDCGRRVWLSNDAPGFLPIGETEITWTAHDAGPYNSVAATHSITQRVIIEDTQAPLLVKPDGFSRYADNPVDLNTTPFDFGSARVSDLADPNPVVSKKVMRLGEEVTLLEPDKRYQVIYEAIDDSGNSTANDADHPTQYTQLVTFKTPSTNTRPTADAISHAAVTSSPLKITLTGKDTDYIDDQFDPLSFNIVQQPEHGEFIVPDYPYFIEDLRLKPTSPPGNYTADTLSCPQQDGTDQNDAKVFEGKLGLLEGNQHRRWIERCYCDNRNKPPKQLLYAPIFMQITDDDDSFVSDKVWSCNVNDAETRNRVSKYHDGEFIAGYGSFGSTSAGGVFQIDPNKNLWFTLRTSGGSSSTIAIDGYNENLERLDSQAHPPSAATYSGSTLNVRDHGTTMNASNLVSTHVDPVRGVVYVNDKRKIYMFDYRDPEDEFLGLVNGNEGFGECGAATSASFSGYWMVTDSKGDLYLVCKNRVIKFSAPELIGGKLQAGSMIGWLGKCTGNKLNQNNTPYNNCDMETLSSKGFQCTDDTCEVDVAEGDGPGQFDLAAHLAINPNDVLYVVDSGNDRIQRFGPDGTFAGQAQSTGKGVSVDGDFALGNMGRPKHVSVNSREFHVLEYDRYSSGGDYFLHVFDASPFTEATNSSAAVEYVSEFNFQGTDSFSFRVDDGIYVSESAAVDISVDRAYRRPYDLSMSCYSDAGFVNAIECRFAEDESTYMRLGAQDHDGFITNGGLDVHTIDVQKSPTHGSLKKVNEQANYAEFVFTPSKNYYGVDSFEFVATDCISGIPEGYCDLAEFDSAYYQFTITPSRDDTTFSFPETVTVARGFNTVFKFDYDDVDGDSFPHPEALWVEWGDGSGAAQTNDWQGIGIVDGNDDPIQPQYQADANTGVFIGAHVYDTASAPVSLCFYAEGDREPSCGRSSIVEVKEVVQLSVSRVENLNAVDEQKIPAAEPNTDYEFIAYLQNLEPSGWAGLSAENIQVRFDFPNGISVTSTNNQCSAGNISICVIPRMEINELIALKFILTIDPVVAADTYLFSVGVEIEHDGPSLNATSHTSLGIEIGDDDNDGVINYYDDFKNDSRYSKDSDQDGIADEWEEKYGLSVNDPSDASKDKDRDGATNLREFQRDGYPLLSDAALTQKLPQLTGVDPDQLGVSVAAGDINNDGYSDVVAGAPTWGDTGAVTVSYGSESGASEAQWLTPATALTGYGRTLAVGDLNNDAFADVVVASSTNITVHWGSAAGLSGVTVIPAVQPLEDSFGSALLVADLDGDSSNDLIVGAQFDTIDPNNTQSTNSTGLVYFYFGHSHIQQASPPVPDFFIQPDSVAERSGGSLTAADLDGDGQPDLLIGAPFFGPGKVYGYFASQMDFSQELLLGSHFVLEGAQDGDRFGYALATGEDIGDDGVSDLVIGAYNYEAKRGAVYVFSSSEIYWDDGTKRQLIEGPDSMSQFGVAVALSDGSSYSEGVQLLVGANRYADTSSENQGQVRLYALRDEVDSIFYSVGSNHSMQGYAVASAGDVDADGEPDFLIGAPNLAVDNYHGGKGRVSVLFGSNGTPQEDQDDDKVADFLDNCIDVANTRQQDVDEDGVGSACDDDEVISVTDTDQDGVLDDHDNCPTDVNPAQLDTDGDGVGDACEVILDQDNDSVADHQDNCPSTPNPDQADQDGDSVGDVCDQSAIPDRNTSGGTDSSGGSRSSGGTFSYELLIMLFLLITLRLSARRRNRAV